MQCQNRVRMGVDTQIPCEHTAIDEASSGLPVCGCCMLLGPLWEQAQQEVDAFIAAAAERGQHGGIIQIGFTRDHEVIVRGVPAPQTFN